MARVGTCLEQRLAGVERARLDGHVQRRIALLVGKVDIGARSDGLLDAGHVALAARLVQVLVLLLVHGACVCERERVGASVDSSDTHAHTR